MFTFTFYFAKVTNNANSESTYLIGSPEAAAAYRTSANKIVKVLVGLKVTEVWVRDTAKPGNVWKKI